MRKTCNIKLHYGYYVSWGTPPSIAKGVRGPEKGTHGVRKGRKSPTKFAPPARSAHFVRTLEKQAGTGLRPLRAEVEDAPAVVGPAAVPVVAAAEHRVAVASKVHEGRDADEEEELPDGIEPPVGSPRARHQPRGRGAGCPPGSRASSGGMSLGPLGSQRRESASGHTLSVPGIWP